MFQAMLCSEETSDTCASATRGQATAYAQMALTVLVGAANRAGSKWLQAGCTFRHPCRLVESAETRAEEDSTRAGGWRGHTKAHRAETE